MCPPVFSACVPDRSWQLGLDPLAVIYMFITTLDAAGHPAAHAVRCESLPRSLFLVSAVCGCLGHTRVPKIPVGAYS